MNAGAAAKGKTKKFLERHGYIVADFELIRMNRTPFGMFPTKRDQWGADLIAADAERILLVQVKSGASARIGTFPDARRKFADYQLPAVVKKVVIAWTPGGRTPRLIDGVTGEELDTV